MKTTVRRRVAEHVVLPKLEQGALRVILYFDIFGHPVDSREIHAFLPSRALSVDAVEHALQSLLRKSLLRKKRGYYFLASASDRCVDERVEKQQRAAHRLMIAAFVARFIGHFPFVRAVMLSGELSKGVAGPDSDIDFVVVARKGRMWICRTFLIAFKKLFLLNSKKYFCLNHFITENNLSVDSRNPYSALELATLYPLVNRHLHAEYLRANEWICEYFPNRATSNAAEQKHAQPLIQSLLEKLIPRHWADRVDISLMARWQKLWNLRYANLSVGDRSHMFQCLPGISTAYGEDFEKKVLGKYAYRLQQYGLPPLGQAN